MAFGFAKLGKLAISGKLFRQIRIEKSNGTGVAELRPRDEATVESDGTLVLFDRFLTFGDNAVNGCTPAQYFAQRRAASFVERSRVATAPVASADQPLEIQPRLPDLCLSGPEPQQRPCTGLSASVRLHSGQSFCLAWFRA